MYSCGLCNQVEYRTRKGLSGHAQFCTNKPKDGFRYCYDCDLVKSVSEFYSTIVKDKIVFSNLCKECKRKLQKKYKEIRGNDVKEVPKSLDTSIFKPDIKRRKYWNNIVKDIEAKNHEDPYKSYGVFPGDLAEFAYNKWSDNNDLIIDPFSGRSTRALIALYLGRKYEGYEISPSTYNRTLSKIKDFTNGKLHLSDGCLMVETKDCTSDLVFTCPPYPFGEKYESVPNQLSDIKHYDEFMKKIDICLKNCFRVLKSGKFCIFVVGDMRNRKTFYPYHVDTILLMKKNGFELHDVVIIPISTPRILTHHDRTTRDKCTAKNHEYMIVAKKPGEL